MGTVLLSGGLIGAAIGLYIFNYLKSVGQVDLLVKTLLRNISWHYRQSYVYRELKRNKTS